MNDTNYIGSIVKILEIPKQKIIHNDILVIKIRVQLSQFRNTKIVTLVFWGNLAYDVINYYKISDYILIEGYLSLQDKKSSKLTTKNQKKVEITVLNIYPFFF